MAKTSYDACLNRLLADEGGYSNLSADPGGPTNWGITLVDARLHWKSNATARDVQMMPVEVAKVIYRAKYWDSLRCDELPAGVDYAIFDYGVNSGIGRAGKVLRRKLGLSGASYKVTDAVITAASVTYAATLSANICDERLAFMKSLKTWPVFGRGWGRRVAGVRATAIGMTTNATVVMPASTFATGGKAIVPKPTAAHAAIASATAVTAASSAGAANTAVAIAIVLVVLAVGVAAILLVNHLRNVKQEAAVPEPAVGA